MRVFCTPSLHYVHNGHYEYIDTLQRMKSAQSGTLHPHTINASMKYVPSLGRHLDPARAYRDLLFALTTRHELFGLSFPPPFLSSV